MRISVREAALQLERRGLLNRQRDDHSELVVQHIEHLVGRRLPEDLVDFYRERIARIGEFLSIVPHWNKYSGWRTPENLITRLQNADAVPLFNDGCGNFYGLDLASGLAAPAVYFFDHERDYEAPEWAAGSSLGAFLLLLADSDRAHAENWPAKWQLQIDPELEHCPRAPALWNAG